MKPDEKTINETCNIYKTQDKADIHILYSNEGLFLHELRGVYIAGYHGHHIYTKVTRGNHIQPGSTIVYI